MELKIETIDQAINIFKGMMYETGINYLKFKFLYRTIEIKMDNEGQFEINYLDKFL